MENLNFIEILEALKEVSRVSFDVRVRLEQAIKNARTIAVLNSSEIILIFNGDEIRVQPDTEINKAAKEYLNAK